MRDSWVVARIGWAAIAAAASALTCSNPSAPASGVADFEVIWAAVDSVYPYLGYKGIDWDSIGTVYRGRVKRGTEDVDVILLEMLGELRDGHAYLRPAGGRAVPMQADWVRGARGEVWPYFSARQQRALRAWNPGLLLGYFGAADLHVTPDSVVGYGVLEGDVGYVYVSRFYPPEMLQDVAVGLDFVRDTRALILDVRNNNGGSGGTTRDVVGRFLAQPLEGMTYYKRGGRYQWPPVPTRGPFQYTKPVVLLVNGRCFSAAEGFAEMMKQLPNVTLLGDTTAGGSGGVDDDALGFFRLPAGAELQVPTVDMRRYDGLPWEWVGIAPDAFVNQTEADRSSGVDRQLEAALALLRQ